MVLLQQMIIFFLLMVVGMYAKKIGLIDEKNHKQLSGIVISICNPALILVGSMGNEPKLQPSELVLILLLAFSIFSFLILLAVFIPNLIGFKPENLGMARMMLVFSNVGFMGMPLVSSLYGAQALIYVTLFLIPFNILLYTYGVHVIQGTEGKFEMKKLANAGVIAGILSLIIYFLPIKIPYIITESFSMLSKLTGPLSMMIIGASMLDINWKDVFSDIRLLIFSAIKLIILPVLILLVLKGFIEDEMLLGVCLVMLATPIGSMTAMFASQYNEESYPLATKGIALTTALTVITIPLVSLITGIGG